MKFTGLSIGGIDIIMENEHYILHKNGVKMRCDFACCTAFGDIFVANKRKGYDILEGRF